MSKQTYSAAGNQPGYQTMTYEDRKLLKTADEVVIYTKYGAQSSIPDNNGDTINWNRWSSLGTSTTALIEGVNPVAQNLTVTQVSATVAEYGGVVELTKKLLQRSRDKVKAQAAERLGVQAGESCDTIARDVYMAGTSYSFANAGASRATLDDSNLINLEDIAAAVNTLKRNKTTPLKNGNFIGIWHPDTVYTLRQQDDFRRIYEASNKTDVFDGHTVTLIEGVYFFESTIAKIWSGGGALGTTGARNDGTNYDVYGTLIFGSDAFGTVDLQKTLQKMIWKELGSAGTKDALNLIATAGWYAEFAAKILNDDFMTRIEHTCLLRS